MEPQDIKKYFDQQELIRDIYFELRAQLTSLESGLALLFGEEPLSNFDECVSELKYASHGARYSRKKKKDF